MRLTSSSRTWMLRATKRMRLFVLLSKRQFEIIGEALNQLSKFAPDIARRVSDLRQIVGFRNILIHGYAAIDHGRVWHIAQTSLPGLRREVSALLAELGGADP